VLGDREQAGRRLRRFLDVYPQLMAAHADGGFLYADSLYQRIRRALAAAVIATSTANVGTDRRHSRGHATHMKTRNDKQLVVGLDIGTSKVTAIVGEYAPGESVEVIGLGTHVSRGMKRGSVVDIESTVHSIQRAWKKPS